MLEKVEQVSKQTLETKLPEDDYIAVLKGHWREVCNLGPKFGKRGYFFLTKFDHFTEKWPRFFEFSRPKMIKGTPPLNPRLISPKFFGRRLVRSSFGLFFSMPAEILMKN